MANDTNTEIEIEYLRGKGCDWIAYVTRPGSHALTVKLTRKDPALRGVAGISRYWVATARGGVHVTADTREAATLAAVAAMAGGAK